MLHVSEFDLDCLANIAVARLLGASFILMLPVQSVLFSKKSEFLHHYENIPMQ